MADLLGTAVSGLLAYQRALNTTSHNITNVNTPGYSRQRVELSSSVPQYIGGNYVGSGVDVQNVRRVYDEFLGSQVRSTTSMASQHDATYELSVQIDNMLADPQAGLSPVLQSFFNAVQDLSTDPTSTPARQVVLSEGESLVARFNDLFSRLDELRNGVNTRLTSQVRDINSLAKSIADVNEDIINAPTGPNGQVSGDLLDRRDQLLNELSEMVSLSTVKQDDGSVNVFIGNGQSLVVGISAQTLATVSDPYDPSRKQIAYVDASGNSTNITSQLNGGKLGGTLEFRDQILEPAMNQLGRVAFSLSQTFNDQHKLGQDLDGNLGADFFSIGSAEVLPNSGNTGSGVISTSIADLSQLTTSDYRISRSGTDYTLTRMSDGATTDLDAAGFPGSAVTVDGLQFSLGSGTIADGDRFLVRPTRIGAQSIGMAIDHTNEVAAAAPIRTVTANANTGTGSVSAGTVNPPSPVNSALRNTVTITFDSPPTTFDVYDSTSGTALASDVSYTSGGNISYNGWTVQIKGTPAAGDVFTIESNVGGSGDNRNAVLLAAVHEKGALDGGRTTLVDAYGSMVGDVGSRTRQAELAGKAQNLLKDQAVAAREGVSGVNLDEEAANLVRYQQAYQAAAQAISVANTLFQSVLSAIGR